MIYKAVLAERFFLKMHTVHEEFSIYIKNTFLDINGRNTIDVIKINQFPIRVGVCVNT